MASAAAAIQVEALASGLETTQTATTMDQKTFDDLPMALAGAARGMTHFADLRTGAADTAAIGYGDWSAGTGILDQNQRRSDVGWRRHVRWNSVYLRRSELALFLKALPGVLHGVPAGRQFRRRVGTGLFMLDPARIKLVQRRVTDCQDWGKRGGV